MVETFLKTKCMPPPLRAALVPRPRLDALLRGAVIVPLTLVSAPPGSGKTTAVLAALRALQSTSDVALAWLGLDEHDNETVRFWRYVLTALQTDAADLPLTSAVQLAAAQPPLISAVLAELLNHIAGYPRQVLLVLDDYHLIHQPDIHHGLGFLLEHAPANLHLLLLTRADPPLPLHRLRARGQLLEVRAADLRFDLAEAAAFLNGVMALALSADEVASLAERTEGWAAGLQLAGLALQGAPEHSAPQHTLIERLAQSNRYILEYLAEEVLAQQTAQMQTFLLQTSILDRLCAALCDAVTGGQDSAALLDTLVQRNLFVYPAGAAHPDSGGRRWFRYHPLFADLLRGLLSQQQPSQPARLHQRAAGWYEQAGAVEPAIEHALAAEDYTHAGRLLDTHARQMAMEGRLFTVERWLSRLPQSRRALLPGANLAFAWALLLRGRYAEIPPYIEQAEAAVSAGDRALQAEAHALRAGLADALGQPDEGVRQARLALAHVPPENLFTRAAAQVALAGALRVRGETDAAIAAYEQALPLCHAAGLTMPELLCRAQLGMLWIAGGRLRRAEGVTRPVLDAPFLHPAGSAVLGALSDVLIEWNRLDAATAHLQQALTLAQQSGHNAALVTCLALRVRLCRIQQDYAGAQAALDTARAQVHQGVPGWVALLLTHEQARLWLDQSALDRVEHLLAQAETQMAAQAAGGYFGELLPLLRARLLLRREQAGEAQAVLDAVLQSAQAGGRQGRVLEALLLRALAFAARHDAAAAERDLLDALELAAPEGYVRVFVDEGAPLAGLLAPVSGDHADYVRALLAAFPPGERLPAPTLPDALTERELDVLRLMARGLTYQDIADTLVISINTVRHHVKGIYSKLQADTRTLALEQARLLNLL